jgi:hypothetical protein
VVLNLLKKFLCPRRAFRRWQAATQSVPWAIRNIRPRESQTKKLADCSYFDSRRFRWLLLVADFV